MVVAVLIVAMLRAGSPAQSAPLAADSLDIDLEYVVLPAETPDTELTYTGFRVGFNPQAHQPNYAAWTLTPERTFGPYTRKDAKFAADPAVKGCASLNDYRRSGYDRGHIVAAADMKWHPQAMSDCHLLTNISPQVQALNAGAWATLENLERRWANKFGRVVIVAGPVLTDRLSLTIGEGKVPVPERFFKVIIAPDANPPMGIGFIMPNAAVPGGTQQAATTIDQVEAITGMDFFSALPDEIENAIEAQNSFHQWNKR